VRATGCGHLLVVRTACGATFSRGAVVGERAECVATKSGRMHSGHYRNERVTGKRLQAVDNRLGDLIDVIHKCDVICSFANAGYAARDGAIGHSGFARPPRSALSWTTFSIGTFEERSWYKECI